MYSFVLVVSETHSSRVVTSPGGTVGWDGVATGKIVLTRGRYMKYVLKKKHSEFFYLNHFYYKLLETGLGTYPLRDDRTLRDGPVTGRVP